MRDEHEGRLKVKDKGIAEEERSARETSSSILRTLMYADWASAKAAISNRISLYIYLSCSFGFFVFFTRSGWSKSIFEKSKMLMRPRLHYSFPFSPIEDCNLRIRSLLVCFCVKKKTTTKAKEWSIWLPTCCIIE